MHAIKSMFSVVLVCGLFINIGCQLNETAVITNPLDYDQYLKGSDNNQNFAQNEFDFWTDKLNKNPGQYPYLAKIAGYNTQLFQQTGNVQYLITAEENLEDLNENVNYQTAGYMRSLAQNYISQHRFKEARDLLVRAEKNGEKLSHTRKMLFDVYLELGDDKRAEEYLLTFKNMKDFDYLIRLSKWNDHKGNLDAAIVAMEHANTLIENKSNDIIKAWTYTNLGDYYAHANRLADSYQMYLKALEIDAKNAHAKKGIAWMAYSHENNPTEAMRILNAISVENSTPDYALLKAEIAEYKKDEKGKKQWIAIYMKQSQVEQYGDMMNKYNILLYTDELNELDKAEVLARKEIENRPTPLSYDLLAWTYYHQNKPKEALKIMEQHVIGKTFEPHSQFHLALIYKANGMDNEAQKLKSDLLESSYELGPVLVSKIETI